MNSEIDPVQLGALILATWTFLAAIRLYHLWQDRRPVREAQRVLRHADRDRW